jgi:hypothetical protein
MLKNTELYDDFVQYSIIQMANNDLDPEYLVLEDFVLDVSLEQGLWATLLHAGYCHVVSALIAFSLCPYPCDLPEYCYTLPIEVERRGFRGGRLRTYIHNLLTIRREWGSFVNYFTDQFGSRPEENWFILRNKLQQIWGNGRWATYKTGEVMMIVNKLNVLPTDMDNSHSSGPRMGLGMLYEPVLGNTHIGIKKLDNQALDLLKRLTQLEGVDIRIDQLETMLCEFHSMAVGRYYPGHDIDLLQQQLLAIADCPQDISKHIWELRPKIFPHECLGELHGWSGIDRERKKFYQKTGVIPVRGVHP